MKKAAYLLIAAVLFFMVFSTCTQSVTAPPEPTPDATRLAAEVLVSVPGGTFTQTDGSNSFSHTISAFKIGKYEVTYDLWYWVYHWATANGYTFANAGRENNSGPAGGPPTLGKSLPVIEINWRDAIVWCNAYSQKEGLTPVYYSDTASAVIKSSADGAYGSSINTTPGSYDNPYVYWNANGFRLPTEGEWQYAASYKDGSSWTPWDYASGAFADYNHYAATGLVAWYYNNVAPYGDTSPHEVGTKAPNALGIYDMSGNVLELCWDWQDFYPSASTDYRGASSSPYRTIRGGNISSTTSVQIGARRVVESYIERAYQGFRLAKTDAAPNVTPNATATAMPTETTIVAPSATPTSTDVITIGTATMTDTEIPTPTVTSTCQDTTWYIDADNDGYGSSSGSVVSCTQPAGYVADSSDCADNDATTNPGAVEVCDGVNNTCSGPPDYGAIPPVDFCGTLGVCAAANVVCAGGGGWQCQYTLSHEFIEASCSDGLDNDCDGLVDSADPDCP